MFHVIHVVVVRMRLIAIARMLRVGIRTGQIGNLVARKLAATVSVVIAGKVKSTDERPSLARSPAQGLWHGLHAAFLTSSPTPNFVAVTVILKEQLRFSLDCLREYPVLGDLHRRLRSTSSRDQQLITSLDCLFVRV
jgi:hypothetical protein